MDTEPNALVQYSVAGLAGLAGVAFWLQKLFKGWKETRVESSVISIMHTELERMAKQNTILASELNKLQLEIVRLNTALGTLTGENQTLYSQVSALTQEINNLHKMLSIYKRGAEADDFTS